MVLPGQSGEWAKAPLSYKVDGIYRLGYHRETHMSQAHRGTRRLCSADNRWFRARFAEDVLRCQDITAVSEHVKVYRTWLRSRGVDPATGRMTEAGLAFFRTCLDATAHSEKQPLLDVQYR